MFALFHIIFLVMPFHSYALRTLDSLQVAVVSFVTDISNDGWRDALYVQAHAAKKAAAESKHHMKLVALVPVQLSKSHEAILLDAGFEEVIRKSPPVAASEVQGQMAREHMEHKNGIGAYSFMQVDETVKYWGASMMQYDRALVIDADVVVMHPMDELMERKESLIGVFDHGLDGKASTMPPTQGGFLLFRPNMTDFEQIKSLTREGDWGGGGWKSSGIGYCYGGVGPDGLLAYYYNKDVIDKLKQKGKENLSEGLASPGIEGSRYLAADRVKYDVVLNERLRNEVDAGTSLAQGTTSDTLKTKEETVAAVTSVHFTGDCIKPWTCSEPKHWFCEGLMKQWWQLRSEVAAERGVPAGGGCKDGVYTALKLPAPKR